MLRYRFWPFSLPTDERPELPSDPQTITDIDEGRGVVMETARGLELKGCQASWTQEQLAAALAYVQKR